MARLRIMSSNLLAGGADVDDLRRKITAEDPDVIAVQELGFRCATVIDDLFPHASLDPQDDGFGLGIAARHPIDTERMTMPGRPGWIARLDPDSWPALDQPITVFGVHLANPIDGPPLVVRRERGAQVDRIRDYVEAEATATVVIGDMNSTPVWREYRRLAKLGVEAARATRTTRRTWNQFLWGPRLLRIDHAFVSGATPLSTHVVKVTGSDHRSLVVDIDI